MKLATKTPDARAKFRPVLGSWRPPFFYGWLLVGVVFLNEFMAAGNGGLTISLFYAPIHESLGWSLTLFTGAATVSAVAGILVMPILGPIMDKYGPRPIMLYGAIAGGVGLILLSRMTQVWHFWVLYCFVGALGLNELGSFSTPIVISKWFIRQRGRAMALASNGTLIGGVVMTPVLGYLITHIGWRYTWAIMGVIVIVVMVPVVYLFMCRLPEDLGLRPDGDTPDEAAAFSAGSRRRGLATEENWTFKEAIRTRTLWVLIAALNLTSFVGSIQSFHSITVLTKQMGLSASTAGAIFSVRLAIVSLGRVPWGFIAERVPIRYCLAFCFVVKSTSLLWLVWLPQPWGIVMMLITVGLGGAQGLLQPLTLANYFGRGSQGTIQGMLRPFLAVPSLVGPVLVAIMFDHLGSFNLAFTVASILGIIAGVIVFFAKPPVRPAGYLPQVAVPAA